MYKLFIDLNDGSNHIFYTNSVTPHLWLLATDGQYSYDKERFCDNLIEIASQFNDELFITEVATLISHLKSKSGSTIQISGPSANYQLADLKQMVDAFDYEKIFGTQVDKVEYYVTAESQDYFKDKRKAYRAQYRSISSILITINVIVFVINMVFGYTPYQFIFGAIPFSVYSFISILLAGFTHFSIFHIFFNMSFLQSMGPTLETILGKWKFVILYFVSLFVSGIFVIFFTSGLTATAGASGALYGLFAYFICYIMKYGTNNAHKRSVLSSFGINILITLLYPGISVAGHIGGAIAGVIFFAIDQSRK